MSQSPSNPTDNPPEGYQEGWDALFRMLYDGASFSGRERNCCFLNTGATAFADVSAVSGLDFADDGRAVGVVDWDLDGLLDVWITNRTGPRVRFMRNTHPGENHYVAVRLEGRSCNRDAIGARVELHLTGQGGQTYVKTVRAGEGFLSQSTKWLHFGLGDSTVIDRLVVSWPGGSTETFSDIQADGRYLIVQGNGKATPWSRPARSHRLEPTELNAPPASDVARIVLAGRVPMPDLRYVNEAGAPVTLRRVRQPTLVNLWASWCAPCRTELSDFADHKKQIDRSGLRIIAVSVDEKSDRSRAAEILDELNWSFDSGYAPSETLDMLDGLQKGLLSRKRRLPVPTSFLIDGSGQLAVIYKGPVTVAGLLSDVRMITSDSTDMMLTSLPFAGRWHKRPAVSANSWLELAKQFTAMGYTDLAGRYLELVAAGLSSRGGVGDSTPASAAAKSIAKSQLNLGVQLAKQGNPDEAIAAFQKALRIDPGLAEAHFNLGFAMKARGRLPEAVTHYQRALALEPDNAKTHNNLGKTLEEMGRVELAINHYRQAIAAEPNLPKPHYNLAQALTRLRQLDEAVEQYRVSLRLDPDNPPTLNSLAWVLATHPDESRRRTAEAIRHAERAVELTENRDPGVLHTLAVAYAAAGDFDRAEQTAVVALAQASAAGNQQLASRINRQLEKYRSTRAKRASESE